jgi:heme/copper-type cytochrome/quinol oxidase subunit 3
MDTGSHSAAPLNPDTVAAARLDFVKPDVAQPDVVRPDVVQLGVALLLSAEAMFFVALTGAFLVLKSAEPPVFSASANQLDPTPAAVGGICLLAGSVLAMIISAANPRPRAAVTVVLLMGLSSAAVVAAAGLQLHRCSAGGINNFVGLYGIMLAAIGLHQLAGCGIAVGILVRSRTIRSLPLAMRPWTNWWHFATLAGGLLYLLCYYRAHSV